MCWSPRCSASAVDHPGDAVTVQRAAALVGQQQGVLGVDERGAVLLDAGDQVRVQRQVPVLAQLADRDVQPRCGPDLNDSVGLQCDVLADPQAGAKEHLDGDAYQHAGVGLGGTKQSGRGRVVERLGQRVVDARQVAEEDGDPGGCLGPVPFLDPDEEHPQRPENRPTPALVSRRSGDRSCGEGQRARRETTT
jgi:hypothetical protein